MLPIMNRRYSFAHLIPPALAICAAFAVGATVRADDRKAEVNKMMEAIRRNGKLPAGKAGADYWRHAELMHGGKKRTILATALNAKASTRSGAATGKVTALTTGSTLTAITGATVGE